MSSGPVIPKYMVYVPSKGRAHKPWTIKLLVRDAIPHWVVIEPQQYDAYVKTENLVPGFSRERLLLLPENDMGLIGARNWIKAHSIAAGHIRHWQLDDNIKRCTRFWENKRIPAGLNIGLRVTEDLTDRYTNVAIAGLNYEFFAFADITPFYHNKHVYSCTLILNEIPHRWRSVYNDDTDICLQVLADGWYTILMNVFSVKKIQTMLVEGGNTDDLYKGDGRAKMARALERLWPGVVKVRRRFGRPQHIVFDAWKRFDTPLKLKEGIDLSKIPKVNEYGMDMVQVRPQIKSKDMNRIHREWRATHPT